VGAEQEREVSPAAEAEIRTQLGAGHAAAWQEKVENHISATVERKTARVAHDFVSKALLLERVLVAP
jgi:hypothetical protein